MVRAWQEILLPTLIKFVIAEWTMKSKIEQMLRYENIETHPNEWITNDGKSSILSTNRWKRLYNDLQLVSFWSTEASTLTVLSLLTLFFFSKMHVILHHPAKILLASKIIKILMSTKRLLKTCFCFHHFIDRLGIH